MRDLFKLVAGFRLFLPLCTITSRRGSVLGHNNTYQYDVEATLTARAGEEKGMREPVYHILV